MAKSRFSIGFHRQLTLLVSTQQLTLVRSASLEETIKLLENNPTDYDHAQNIEGALYFIKCCLSSTSQDTGLRVAYAMSDTDTIHFEDLYIYHYEE